MEHLTSRANPFLAHVRKLASSGAERREAGEFVCDGGKLFREALRSGAEITAVVCTPERREEVLEAMSASGGVSPGFVGISPDSGRASSNAGGVFPDSERASPNSGTVSPDSRKTPPEPRLATVPPAVMESLSPSRTPQGILCVCRMRQTPLPDRLPGRRYLVLDGVQDPGNVGTILRTADALGGDGVFLLDGCADRYHPRTVRATMGALFRLPVWTCGRAELGDLLRRSEMPLYGAALDGQARDLRTLDLSRFAAAIGSEGRGLSRETLSLCGGTVRIPMRPRCESLNAAMAAGVILWEAVRSGAAWPGWE